MSVKGKMLVGGAVWGLCRAGLAGLGSAGWRLLWLLWLVGSRSAGEKSGERIRDRSDFWAGGAEEFREQIIFGWQKGGV